MQRLQENSIINTYFKELSIQIDLSGLSFCIFNPALNCIESIYHFKIDLNHTNTLEMEKQLRALLFSESDLRQDFNTIKVLHNNQLFSLIPKALFTGKEFASSYLKYSVETNPTDFVEIDDIEPLEAINLYVPNTLVNNILLEHYGYFDYQHFTTSLLKMFLTHYASHEQEATYMYVEQSSFYLVYFKNKKLQFLNRFPYETIEDLLYFLLYSVEQLEVKTEKVPIYISGEITRNSLIYHGLRKYIRNVYFMKTNAKPLSQGMDQTLARQHFLLTQQF
ncbi:DUF3822 family protein [Capnocytophaga canimorsus]|nr:DUF3822 family protein [Capnocytophaga canimorsus]WGU69219.1 DUF3822 family protein [Capnocytophaga canimorsus]WGU69654.1 DUF3822 family protein [Capnocytophaga canimorsus]